MGYNLTQEEIETCLNQPNNEQEQFRLLWNVQIPERLLRKYDWLWTIRDWWGELSMFQDISEEFIREYKDQLDWVELSNYKLLSKDFIREFKDKVEWREVSLYQEICQISFLGEFKDKVKWNKILEHLIMPEYILEKFMYEFGGIENILYQQFPDEEFLEKYLSLYENKHNVLRLLSARAGLSEEFKKKILELRRRFENE